MVCGVLRDNLRLHSDVVVCMGNCMCYTYLSPLEVLLLYHLDLFLFLLQNMCKLLVNFHSNNGCCNVCLDNVPNNLVGMLANNYCMVLQKNSMVYFYLNHFDKIILLLHLELLVQSDHDRNN